MARGGLEFEMYESRPGGRSAFCGVREMISWYVLCCCSGCVWKGEDVNGGCDRAWKYLR